MCSYKYLNLKKFYFFVLQCKNMYKVLLKSDLLFSSNNALQLIKYQCKIENPALLCIPNS